MSSLDLSNEDVVERARLACLRNLNILDTGANSRMDRLTHVTSRHFEVPIALVSLVDEERQWFKSRVGLDAFETPRCVAFCDYAIRDSKVMVVEDATQDKRFADNPLVIDAPNIRFYAGAPIIIDEVHNIGTLCVIDQKPRAFLKADCEKLAGLARSMERMIIDIHRSRTVVRKVHQASTGRTAAS